MSSLAHLNIGLACFAACYALAWITELIRWRHGGRLVWLASSGLTAAGFTAHTLYLLVRSQKTQLPPLLSSFHDWLLVLAWLAVLLIVVMMLFDWKSALGLVLHPLVLLLVFASQFVPIAPRETLDALRGWVMLHVSLLVLGTGAVGLGFVMSLLYLWQYNRLKLRQNSGTLTPGNLERLAKWNRWALITAVPLLTLGVVSGVGLVLRGTSSVSAFQDPLVIMGVAGWLVMTGLLGWVLAQQATPGRQMAYLNFWAGGFLLLTMVGAQVITASLKMKSVHGGGTPVASEPRGTKP